MSSGDLKHISCDFRDRSQFLCSTGMAVPNRNYNVLLGWCQMSHTTIQFLSKHHQVPVSENATCWDTKRMDLIYVCLFGFFTVKTLLLLLLLLFSTCLSIPVFFFFPPTVCTSDSNYSHFITATEKSVHMTSATLWGEMSGLLPFFFSFFLFFTGK